MTMAGDNTIWLEKGQTVPRNGFLVSFDKVDNVVNFYLGARSYKSLCENDLDYKDNVIRVNKMLCDNTITGIKKENEYAISGLKKELSEKSVWYKHPAVMFGLGIITTIVVGISIKK